MFGLVWAIAASYAAADHAKRKAVLRSREQIERDIEAERADWAETHRKIEEMRARWAEEDRIYKRKKFLEKLGPKGQRMNDRMERRRDQIHKRNWTIVWIVVFWCCAPAVAIAIIAIIWRLCAYAIAF